MFDDVLEANERFAASYPAGNLTGRAARGLALVTCIDSRIEPLAMLGLVPGDAKVLRNAGARVTGDVLRSLVLATNLLNVTRIAVIQHTECAMHTTNDQLIDAVRERSGNDPSGWDFLPLSDPDHDLAADVEAIRTCLLMPTDLVVAGWRYDVTTGRVTVVVEP